MLVYQRVTSKCVNLKTELHGAYMESENPNFSTNPRMNGEATLVSCHYPQIAQLSPKLERDVSFAFPNSLGIRL